MSIIDEIKDSFKHGTTLTKLIYINLGVFLLLHAGIVILYLANAQESIDTLLTWMAVPASLESLLIRPWTVFSYMFLHKDFFHILFNITWLYWFGKIFLQYLDEKKLLSLYILGGFAGAVVFIASYNIFPVLKEQAPVAIAMGASAAVMAIVIAIAAFVPDHSMYIIFIGPVKIIWIALISFFLSSVVDFSVNTGGKIAHMGGALFGYLFIVRYKQGKDITIWFSEIIDFIFSLFKTKKKMKVSHKRTMTEMEYKAVQIEKQKEIDRILDKISKSGYESLTSREKEMLFKLGK